MTRYSDINGYVVFPSKSMEEEWRRNIKRKIDRAHLISEFSRLLDIAEVETPIHSFFESHPQLLPGVARHHNGPRGDVVVTKLHLGQDFVCDFAFVSENSQAVQFTCIEIESPRKHIFNQSGQFSRVYLDARQQITDWNGWAQQNIRKVMPLFGRLGRWLPDEYYAISLECVLVMGRREQIDSKVKKQRWATENALRQASLHIMTYDRLLEEMENGFGSWDMSMLVCHYRDRALHVKSISC